MLSDEELQDIVLTLENDSHFYDWCTGSSTMRVRHVTEAHWFNGMKCYYRKAAGVNRRQAAKIREYFKWRYLTDQKTPPPCYLNELHTPQPPTEHLDNPMLHCDSYRMSHQDVSYLQTLINDTVAGLSIPTTTNHDQPEFNPMTALTFKTVHRLNDNDLSRLSNEDIYAAIQAEETRIEKMKTIKNQPKSLKAEIAAAEEQLAALITHLDSK